MTQPAEIATAPPKAEKNPDDKKVVLSKAAGGKWILKTSGPIKQRDINHLRQVLRIEYLRAKRRERAAARTATRKELDNAGT